ncbi:MAG: hypothetical protein WCJ51_04350 [Candidatus Moraniibacteriota bacterium]
MKKNKKINKQKIAIFVIVFFVSLFFEVPLLVGSQFPVFLFLRVPFLQRVFFGAGWG